ncbi:MAG TPA: hypothetical protein VFW67_02525 [Burkholderiaceae bacterium]|nr:hypothetical protein [Burkholderiaceae bacterium]
MKWLLWSVVALAALFWTGLVAVGAQLSDWLAGVVASGQAVEVARGAAQWPVPAWLGLWVDPAWVALLQQAWADAFTWLSDLLPATAGWAGNLLGWVAPLLWVVWALGLGLMLLLAGGLHWLMARRDAAAQPSS